MITISAFADEISSDLKIQMDVCQSHGIKCIDVRGIDGVNVSKMTLTQARRYKKQLDDRGFSVPCIGSPLGKIRMDEDFAAHMDVLKNCIDIAGAFGASYIRVFSFYASVGKNIADERCGVMDRMAAMVERAAADGVILLHENEKAIYGATPTGVKDIFAAVRSPHLQGIFDPANFVEEGFAPYTDCWKHGLDKMTQYFHIKDKKPEAPTCVPAGEGKGQFEELFADLQAAGWGGYMTLEPHMSAAGQYAGFTGPDLFGKAVIALKNMLDRHGMSYQ